MCQSKRARITVRIENAVFEKLKERSENISEVAREFIINGLKESPKCDGGEEM